MLFQAEQIEKVAALSPFRLIGRGEVRGIDQEHTGCRFQAPRAPDHQVSLGSSRLDCINQDPWIARSKVDRADDDLMALEQRRQGGTVKDVTLLGRYFWQ